jgi:DNA-binding transcriptional LysR family regulator
MATTSHDTLPSLDRLVAFQTVAASASFTTAARTLRSDKSRVSRLVSALEDELGQRLLARTTRAVTLTREGERLLARIAPHLAGLRAAFAEPTATPEAPSGHVVLSTTPDLARSLLALALASFRVRHPAITLAIDASADLHDLVRARVDLALRVGRPGSSSLVARRVGELSAGFFASPTYLARRGTPTTPASLAEHERLWPAALSGRRAFSGKRRPLEPTLACADFDVLAAAACAGAGIALLPLHVGEPLVAAAQLARVLPEQRRGDAPIYLVWRAERPLPPRIAAVRDHLLRTLTGR